jgi:hypothetical protein
MLIALAYLLPSLLLALVLLRRAYPGERVLLALRARARAFRRTPRKAARVKRPLIHLLLARGGELIACSLAVRPPPAVSALTR